MEFTSTHAYAPLKERIGGELHKNNKMVVLAALRLSPALYYHAFQGERNATSLTCQWTSNFSHDGD